MPALLDTTVRLRTPESRIALINASGIPQSPNPPAMIIMPSRKRPSRALRASGKTFFMLDHPELTNAEISAASFIALRQRPQCRGATSRTASDREPPVPAVNVFDLPQGTTIRE